MSEKLKLNLTTGALERLIGGDTEIEVEIRQAVATNFAKRHLANLISDAVRAEVSQIRQQFNQEVRRQSQAVLNELGELRSQFGGVKFTLSDNAREAVRAEARAGIHEDIKGIVMSSIQELDIQQMVRDQLNVQMKDEVRAQVRQQFNAMMKAV